MNLSLATAPQATSHSLGSPRIAAQLLTFFAAAFLIAWGVWIPLLTTSSLPGQLAFIGLFAPAMAAVLTAAIFGGIGSVRNIFRRLVVVRFPLRWALLSALIMPAIYIVAISAVRALRIGATGPLFEKNSALFILGAFVWLLFVNSGEELGWRGFVLPTLLERTDRVIPVSLGLGVIWGVWHLPLYLIPGQSAFPFPLFVIFTTLLSVLYSVVFLRTKGSLLPALLLHAGTDIAPRVFQLANLPSTFWLIVDVTLALGVTALLIGMRRQLSTPQQWRTEIRSPALC